MSSETNGGIAGWFSSISGSNKASREVVHAKRPVPSSTSTTPSNTTTTQDESFNDDDTPAVWSPTKDSSQNDQLWNQQIDKHISQNRAMANDRSKNQRATKLEEKRSSGKKKPSTATPHPMSSSLFRVGTSQPNHKRPAEVNTTDSEEDTSAPEEKRMRIGDDTTNKVPDTTKRIMSYVGVAAVAVAAVVVLTWRRRRA